MSIQIFDNGARVQITAAQGQTNFTFPFAYFTATAANNDLIVYLTPSGAQPDDTLDKLTISVAYTVTPTGPSQGGTVVLNNPANAGDIITIVRDIPIERTSDYVTGGKLTAEGLNTDLDRIITMIQQNEMTSDDLQLRYQDTAQVQSKHTKLPLPIADTIPHFKADNTGWEFLPYDPDEDAAVLKSDLASNSAGKGASLVGQEGSGTVQDFIDQINNQVDVNQEQILYVGKHGNDSKNGTSVDRAFLTIAAAVNRAITKTPSASNKFVIVVHDSGIYVENIILPQFVSLHAPNAKIDGKLQIAENVKVFVDEIEASTGIALEYTGTSGNSFVRANLISGPSNAAIKNSSNQTLNVFSYIITSSSGDALASDSGGTTYVYSNNIQGSNAVNLSNSSTARIITNFSSGTETVDGTSTLHLFENDATVGNVFTTSDFTTVNRLLKTNSTTTEIVESGISVDGSDNVSGVNDISFNGDLITSGDFNVTYGKGSLSYIDSSGNFVFNTSGDITLTPNNVKLNPTTGINFFNSYNFPTSDGTSGQFITTNGAGQLSFATVGSVVARFPRNFIDGFLLSNDAGDILKDVRIGPGEARDNSNTENMIRNSKITKQLDVNWTEGDNQGGRPSSVPLANATWYHVFIIRRTSDGNIDAGFDTSLSATNLLADATGYAAFRRVGSVRTDNSKNILQFVSYGDKFLWKDPTFDFDQNITTSQTTIPITTPLGVQSHAIMNIHVQDTGIGNVYIRSLAVNDEAPSESAAPLSTLKNPAAGQTVTEKIEVTTNTSSQIAARSSASATGLRIATLGWIDQRGKQ